jgi:hypothetical protein
MASVLLVSCAAELGDTGDRHGAEDSFRADEIGSRRVGDFVSSTCTTAAVAPLSRQVAEEMLCITPGVVVELSEANGISFSSNAVLPFMEATAGEKLKLAAKEQKIILNSGFRTVVQQYLLKKWHQRGRCGILAAASPGRSNHESARAIDVANVGAARSALNRHGWDDPLPRDPVHFEFLDSPDMRGLDVHAFQRLWNRNNKGDQIAEDGDYGSATAERINRAPAAGFPIGACEDPGKGGFGDSFVGTDCSEDVSVCNFSADGQQGLCIDWFSEDETGNASLDGFCSLECEGVCPDRTGSAPTFCAEFVQDPGVCAAAPSPENDQCADISGTEIQVVPRFVGDSGVTKIWMGVCAPPGNKLSCDAPDGGEGECIDTDSMSCGGTLHTGLCPGSSNIRCCSE